ncbi:MAG: hypothetical protein AAGD47_14270 [Pseudomonadota bacterium]
MTVREEANVIARPLDIEYATQQAGGYRYDKVGQVHVLPSAEDDEEICNPGIVALYLQELGRSIAGRP